MPMILVIPANKKVERGIKGSEINIEKTKVYDLLAQNMKFRRTKNGMRSIPLCIHLQIYRLQYISILYNIPNIHLSCMSAAEIEFEVKCRITSAKGGLNTMKNALLKEAWMRGCKRD